MVNKDYYDDLNNISSNLKLSGKHLLPVLKEIKKGQPDRDIVSKNVVNKVFPEKEEKSVFRGMVVPTTTRLHLARKDKQKRTLSLSPNGEGCIYKECSEYQRQLNVTIRDYAAIEVGLRKETFEYLAENETELEAKHPRVAENSRRFKSQYLDEFEISLPSENNDGNILNNMYPHLFKLLKDDEIRRQWISRSFVPQNLYQMEEARWNLMKQLREDNYVVSTWFVDELMWREMNAEGRIIDLWEASTQSNTKLTRRNTPFEGLVLREDK